MLGLVKLQLLLSRSCFVSQHPHLCLQLNNPNYCLYVQLLLALLGAAEVVLLLVVGLQ